MGIPFGDGKFISCQLRLDMVEPQSKIRDVIVCKLLLDTYSSSRNVYLLAIIEAIRECAFYVARRSKCRCSPLIWQLTCTNQIADNAEDASTADD